MRHEPFVCIADFDLAPDHLVEAALIRMEPKPLAVGGMTLGHGFSSRQDLNQIAFIHNGNGDLNQHRLDRQRTTLCALVASS